MASLPMGKSRGLWLVQLCAKYRLVNATSSPYHYSTVEMFFMGCGFTSGGQESWSVFSAAVCKIQASKHYIISLPLVRKIKEAASLKVIGPLYSCLLIACLPSGSRMLN